MMKLETQYEIIESYINGNKTDFAKRVKHMSKVYHTENEELLFNFLKKQLKKVFKENEKVAIKLHMGEPGNKFFIKPEFVKMLVDLLKRIGTKPFLFDSPVTYRSPRNNVKGYLKVAHDHGFSEKTIGAPVVISNESIRVEGKNLSYEICKDLVEADGVLILSHVKGHIASGFGGALKNLAMGAMSKETKNAIHEGGEPVYTEGCVQCGACVEQCPKNAFYEVIPGIYGIDPGKCDGCGECFCPYDALEIDGYARKCDLCGGEPECVKVCQEAGYNALTIIKGEYRYIYKTSLSDPLTRSKEIAKKVYGWEEW